MTSNDNQAIGFGVYTGVSTKGTVVTTETLGLSAGAGFGVLGYYHQSTTTTAAEWSDDATPNFMYNQQVQGNGVAATTGNNAVDLSAWSYSPLKYWPNNTVDRVSFFAYAPYTAQTESAEAIELSTNTTEDEPTLTFSIASTASDMVDLVIATPVYEQAKQATSDNVAFTFNHMLTRLNLTAWVSEDVASTSELNTNTFVYVTDLQLVGTANSSADTKLKDKNNGETTNSLGFYATNKFTYAAKATEGDQTTGTWAALTNATKQTANYDLKSLMTMAVANRDGATGATGTTTDAYNESSVKVTGTATGTSSSALFTADQYAFLLPPADATGITAGTDDVYLYVEYDVVTLDKNLNNGLSVVTQQDIVALPANTLKAGVAYNINLELSLTGVKVSATVSDTWGTATEGNIETPDGSAE